MAKTVGKASSRINFAQVISDTVKPVNLTTKNVNEQIVVGSVSASEQIEEKSDAITVKTQDTQNLRQDPYADVYGQAHRASGKKLNRNSFCISDANQDYVRYESRRRAISQSELVNAALDFYRAHKEGHIVI